MDADQAESIAISALAFLASDMERLSRFLALTGMGPRDLKADARTPRVLAAVLNHLLQDESQLLVFSAAKNIPPEQIAPAHALLEALDVENTRGGS
jgi:uncharacterized protein DUF3572